MCLSSANVFVNDMSAGSGFMAFAANQFGQWSPVGGYLATLLFGVMQALRMRLQSFGIATQLTQMLPYLAALIGIKLTGMRMRAPAANGTPLSPSALRSLSAPEKRRGITVERIEGMNITFHECRYILHLKDYDSGVFFSTARYWACSPTITLVHRPRSEGLPLLHGQRTAGDHPDPLYPPAGTQ